MAWNSFELDTGGGKTCFMITLGDSLFIGTAKDDNGVVERIHELKRDKKTNEFKLKGGEIWGRRSKTPLFERIALQFKDIVSLLRLDKPIQEKAIAALIEIALDLSKAEEAFLDYVETEDAAVSQYHDPKGITPQKNALIYKNPTHTLKEIAEKVLIRIIIAYRKFPEVISIIRGETFNIGKTFVNNLAKLLPADHPDSKSFEYDNNWIKELYDIRGYIEHERWEILPFDVLQSEGDASCHVERCRVVIKSQGEKPINLAAYLNVTLYNMITFIEKMVALAIIDKMPYPTRIVTLPETERPKRNHYRYVADLVPEVKEKLPAN
ncbi:MAG: hypothetical protein HY035_11060 [Nitrospirae bacterium]|nr:hypothetical protein [Nitrospirota bacterium]MBI3378919.1 hypothetical protein [Nitrospirota bacterium]